MSTQPTVTLFRSSAAPQGRPYRAARVLAALTAAQGAAYLLLPRRLVHGVAGRRPEPREVAVTRVLGGRLLLQGLVLGLAPRSLLPRVGTSTAAVDGVHGLSMVALAVASARHRRVALASAGSAFASAVATSVLVPRPDPRRHP